MNEDEFKKHLKDLVQGHHHPEEHDWTESKSAGPTEMKTKGPVQKVAKIGPGKKKSRTAARKA
jgi:hypothetical protein